MTAVIDWERTIHQAMVPFEEIARKHQLVKWEAESRFALQAVQKNVKLRECTQQSVMDAITNVAAVALTLNPADGYAYLVPEYNKDIKKDECHLRISYKGFIKVATSDGPVRMVKAEIVYANDLKEPNEFQYRGPFTEPLHIIANPFEDRGSPIGVYCVAYLHTGECICDHMGWDEVQKIRKCAKFDGVWSQWETEMAKKAIIKRAAKSWPRGGNDARLNETIQVINQSEGGVDDWEVIEQAADQLIRLIKDDDPHGVEEVWSELSDREKEIIWKAKTKGGYFSQDEKKYIRETGYKIVNFDKIDELKEKIKALGFDWEFVHGLLDKTFNEEDREPKTVFELDTLPVGYARWALSELQKMEDAA